MHGIDHNMASPSWFVCLVDVLPDLLARISNQKFQHDPKQPSVPNEDLYLMKAPMFFTASEAIDTTYRQACTLPGRGLEGCKMLIPFFISE